MWYIPTKVKNYVGCLNLMALLIILKLKTTRCLNGQARRQYGYKISYSHKWFYISVSK